MARSDHISGEFRTADLRRGPDGGEVLRSESGLGHSIGADVAHAERLPGQKRQGERGAEDLPAAFAEGAVNFEHELSAVSQSPGSAGVPPALPKRAGRPRSQD